MLMGVILGVGVVKAAEGDAQDLGPLATCGGSAATAPDSSG